MDLVDWKPRFHKRGVAFFKFMESWGYYVARSTSDRPISWQNIPGYITLIKAMLQEMKVRPVSVYPESLKKACYILIANENIFSAFANILFQHTSVYNHHTVTLSLEFFAEMLYILHDQYNKFIPTNFDFHFFFKGIFIMLKMNDLISCEKCLWFIYKIAHLLPSDFYKQHR